VKILYVAPEHVSGGFSLFREGHRRRGNEARWVTFFRNLYGFEEDLCFDLIGMPTRPWVIALKDYLRIGDRREQTCAQVDFVPPGGIIERSLFRARDAVNARRIERLIERAGLNDFDLYHFEEGADPYRDCRWVRRLAVAGKGIVCFYHGTDLRNRGLFEAVHRNARLNLTSEIDLLGRIPGMKYLYLPIDCGLVKPSPRAPDGRIRICHAARNRKFKGSDEIEAVVKRLAARYPIDWVMIENLPHGEAMRLKGTCDIFIDQIADAGGWGYGASSVESLALGLPTVTRMNPAVSDFLREHPFVDADRERLEQALIPLLEDEPLRRELGARGRRWVEERHSLEAVMDCLYGYYDEAGWL